MPHNAIQLVTSNSFEYMNEHFNKIENGFSINYDNFMLQEDVLMPECLTPIIVSKLFDYFLRSSDRLR